MLENSVLLKLKQHRFFAEFFTYKTFLQLRKYLIVGFSTVGLEFVNLKILTDVIGLWYIYSNSIAIFISFVVNFCLNTFWSFNTRGNITRQLVSYSILFVINFFASNIMMYLLTDMVGFPKMISKVFAVGAIVCWNFVIYKKIIYK